MNIQVKPILFALFLFCFTPSIIASQKITYICNYKSWASIDGLHQVDEEFVITFVHNLEKNTALSIGNNGAADVMPVKNIGGVTFIEKTDTGNINITTIDESNSTAHSRNSVVIGELIASQYYGKCDVK